MFREYRQGWGWRFANALGKYPIANSGLGTTPMLASELFKLSFKLDVTTVPYNGGAPVIQAVVGNQTPTGFATLPPAYPQLVAGTLRALAVTSAKRSESLPDVPTMAEAGVEGQESDTMQGVFVPAGTPPDIVALLNREIVAALNALASMKAALGRLDRVQSIFFVFGYVNAVAGFDLSHAVINGASDLFGKLYGDAGKHAA